MLTVLVAAVAGIVPAPAAHSSTGGSFQALYLVARDAKPAAGEKAAIRTDLNRIDGWFRRQTVDHLEPRWVRTTGPTGATPISVVTVRMPRNRAVYEGDPRGPVVSVAYDLSVMGWPKKSAKKLVVFMDIGAGYCGITTHGISFIPMAACGIYPGKTDRWPYGATYVTAHEMTHNFGAVPPCAPHYDGTGHINDDPRDILYSGPTRDWAHLTLDPGHDDYYDTGLPHCRDIRNSTYWTAP